MVKAIVRAYIAHTFKHRKYVKEVLVPKINALGIITKNPFYELDGISKREEVKLADKSDYQGLSSSEVAKNVMTKNDKDKQKLISMIKHNNKTIVPRDLGFIDRTDFTIAFMTEISKGTSDEIFYTGIVKRRPVFLLCSNPEVYDHPWFNYECRLGKICKTEEELLRVLKRKYG